MTQRKIIASEFVADIRNGINNDALMAKYPITLDRLKLLFSKLVTAGHLKQSEIDRLHKPTSQFSCPVCGIAQDNSFNECPKCAIVADIAPKKRGIIFVPNSITPTTPDDFEKLIAVLCEKKGFNVTMPPANTRGYDIELNKDRECIAVQVKCHKATCNTPQILKFQSFLELPLASRFTSGWFISASGFAKAATTHVETERPVNLVLGTYIDNDIVWDYNQETPPWPNTPIASPPTLPPPPAVKYVGVFTCKGGVGKTTVAAHLAGAFALMGYDVVLIDLDPDKNLRKLFLENANDEDGPAALFVPPAVRGNQGTTITVLNHDQWDEVAYRNDTNIVICDCSPVLRENPDELVKKFDYCIIPTTLNPLGIAKNSDVIVRTFKHIRSKNSTADMFVLINGYITKEENRNTVLIDHLKRSIDDYAKEDAKCKFIHPDNAKIRHSTSLLYWGYHIIDGTTPQLAFKEIAGRSYPRIDFLQLAGYLQDHTEIDKLRENERQVDQKL